MHPTKREVGVLNQVRRGGAACAGRRACGANRSSKDQRMVNQRSSVMEKGRTARPLWGGRATPLAHANVCVQEEVIEAVRGRLEALLSQSNTTRTFATQQQTQTQQQQQQAALLPALRQTTLTGVQQQPLTQAQRRRSLTQGARDAPHTGLTSCVSRSVAAEVEAELGCNVARLRSAGPAGGDQGEEEEDEEEGEDEDLGAGRASGGSLGARGSLGSAGAGGGGGGGAAQPYRPNKLVRVDGRAQSMETFLSSQYAAPHAAALAGELPGLLHLRHHLVLAHGVSSVLRAAKDTTCRGSGVALRRLHQPQAPGARRRRRAASRHLPRRRGGPAGGGRRRRRRGRRRRGGRRRWGAAGRVHRAGQRAAAGGRGGGGHA